MGSCRFYFGIAARRQRRRIFGEQTSFFRGLIRCASKRGIRAFVFEPGDLHLAEGRVRGWVPGKGGWRRRWYPLPDVVYDRVWGLGPEERSRYRELVERLTAEADIPVFNPEIGDKLAVWTLLAQDPALAPHLPRTLPLSSENVEELIREYSSVFIKPVRGRQGKGIYRVVRRGANLLTTVRLGSGALRTRAFGSAGELVDRILARGGYGAYLVQQGLDLARAGRRAADVRVVAQRDARGEWRVSGVGVRLGAPGGFLSNLHAGGRASTLSELVRRARLRVPARRLRRAAERLALLAVKSLGEAYPLLGEVGLDLGVDRRGHLWILEANRQPGRATFARAGLRRSWLATRRRVVEFAGFLALRRKAP